MREGKRLSQPMAAEVQEIIYAPRLESERTHIFGFLGAVNMAHLVMLAGQGLLEGQAAARVAQAMLALDAAGPDAMEWDPAREDAYYNYEAALVQRVGLESAGQIHVGRSRNDISASIDRLRVRGWCLRLARRLRGVREALLARAARHADTVMSGYTHLQPSQPVSYGFYLLGLAQAFERDALRLQAACENANRSPLGAAAMAGTSFPIDRALAAGLLGFDGVLEHAQDAVASRDFAIDAMHAGVSIALTWSRLAQDLHVWSSQEFHLLELSDRVSGTSSIMPQKKNPVVIEHLKAKASHAVGHLVSVLATIRATHFSVTIDGCKSSMAGVWPLLQDVDDSLRLVKLVVEETEPCSQHMLDEARLNFSTATDLADALVREHGLPFRQAHHLVGAAVGSLVRDGRPATDLSSERLDAAARDVLGRPLGVSADWLGKTLDPGRAVAARTSVGGTAPSEVRRMADEALARLQAEAARQEAFEARLQQAEAQRLQAVSRLAGQVRQGAHEGRG
jgi:argininosuccinate lyase